MESFFLDITFHGKFFIGQNILWKVFLGQNISWKVFHGQNISWKVFSWTEHLMESFLLFGLDISGTFYGQIQQNS